MNDLINAIILGIIQGITEWLPISSSGHLAIAKELFGIEQPLIFDIVLHLGSLIVILFVFRSKIIELVKGVIRLDKKAINYGIMLFIATIPIAIVGYFFNDSIKGVFDNIIFVGGSLIFTSVIIFLSGNVSNKEKSDNKKSESISFKNIIPVGIIQSLAILPGISRSGMTISMAMITGMNRKDAAEFSFLLFIPAIVGAMILEVGSIGTVNNLSVLLVAFAVVVLTGYFSLKLLLRIIKSDKWSYFGWYCLIIGVLTIILGVF